VVLSLGMVFAHAMEKWKMSKLTEKLFRLEQLLFYSTCVTRGKFMATGLLNTVLTNFA
jgi:hypothetical protein